MIPGLSIGTGGGGFTPAGSSSAASYGTFRTKYDLEKSINLLSGPTTAQMALVSAAVLLGLLIWKKVK